MLDIRSWEVFRSLEPTFVADICMAMVVGQGAAGIMVTRNNQVFSIGSGPLLGLKGIVATTAPRKIFKLSGTEIKGIFSGQGFVIVLTADGEMCTWGSNEVGQLGLGKEFSNVQVPKLLTLPNEDQKVISVACGKWHATALTESGKVYTWGWTDYRKFGPPTSKEAWMPQEVFKDDDAEIGRSKIVTVECGAWSSCALRSNGEVWIWGFSNYMAMAGAYIQPTLVPLKIPVTKVACGEANVLVLDMEGSLYFWGCGGMEMGTKSEPTRVASQVGRVIDIGATWRSTLNVCQGESGVHVWGECQGKYWECPTEAQYFDSVDLVFAADQEIMCRPVVIPYQQEDETQQTLAEDLVHSDTPDIQFKFEDFRRINAHEFVLTSRSTYFAAMFSGTWKESIPSRTPRIIPIEGVDSDVFMHLVHYLYTYRIDYQFALTDDDNSWLKKTLKLLVMADRYGQMDLLSDCETLLMALLTVENAHVIFQIANELNIRDLEKRTLEVMAPPNFGKIAQSNAPAEVVKLIASKLSDMGCFDYNPFSPYARLCCAQNL